MSSPFARRTRRARVRRRWNLAVNLFCLLVIVVGVGIIAVIAVDAFNLFRLGGGTMGKLECYPDGPGYQATDTSRQAAEAIADIAPTLRDRALGIVTAALDGVTADQVAGALEASVLSIRPRIAELNLTGKIIDSGRRRSNRSGRRAIVWILASRGETR